jgi:hypothetical protein
MRQVKAKRAAAAAKTRPVLAADRDRKGNSLLKADRQLPVILG